MSEKENTSNNKVSNETNLIKIKKEKIEIAKLHDEVELIRAKACLAITKNIDIKGKQEADAIERRAASVERRLGRIRLRGSRKYLIVPNPWKIYDIEQALDEIGAIEEDRPANMAAGGGRTR